jgi:hypothetical protein
MPVDESVFPVSGRFRRQRMVSMTLASIDTDNLYVMPFPSSTCHQDLITAFLLSRLIY